MVVGWSFVLDVEETPREQRQRPTRPNNRNSFRNLSLIINFNERSSCKIERLAMKRFKFHRQESFFLYFFLLPFSIAIFSTEIIFAIEKEEEIRKKTSVTSCPSVAKVI